MSIEILPLDSTHVVPAFELATRVFADSSSLHRALQVGLDEYRDYLWHPFERMVNEGISVAAIDSTTGRLLGCLVVTDFCAQANEEIDPGNRLAPLVALGAELTRHYRQRQDVSPGEVALVDMGAVSREAAGMGLYRGMRSEAQIIAKDRGYRRIAGELSSAATQHVVLKRLGHRKLAEVRFEDFEYAGSRPFLSITDPPSIILAEGML